MQRPPFRRTRNQSAVAVVALAGALSLLPAAGQASGSPRVSVSVSEAARAKAGHHSHGGRAGGHAFPRASRRSASATASDPVPAIAAVSSASPAAASSSGALLEAGFEDGLANWNIAGVGEVVPTVESSDVRSGSHAARVVLTGSESRSELSLGGTGTRSDGEMVHFEEGDEYWYGFSFDIESMVWGHPGAHNLIMQLKSSGEGSPNFGLHLWDYAGDDGVSGGRGLWSHSAAGGDRFLAPLEEHRWYDIKIHFRASSRDAGFYEIYLDDQLLESRSGVSMIVPGHSWAYIKNGLYRNGAAIPGTSELLLDDAKLGTSSASVEAS